VWWKCTEKEEIAATLEERSQKAPERPAPPDFLACQHKVKP